MSKLKIGIDARLIGKQRTGDEAVFFGIAKSLAKIDRENEYFLFTDSIDRGDIKKIEERLGIAEKDNFKIVSIKARNKFYWNFWALPRFLRKNPVDIYLTQYIVPFFVSEKIKIITIVHDISFNFFSKFIKFSDLFFLKILIPLSLRRADKILGVSKFTRDEIIKYYKINPSKVDYFYNAVADDFKKEYSREDMDVIRRKYNLPEKFILYVGTLQPRKNIPLLIEGYAKIQEKLGGIKLVLSGNKKSHNVDSRIERAVLKNYLKDSVVFTGFIDETDKPAIFEMAHVFVFPSLYEGFGIPILEAFSKKTPVLASDIPSLREVAENAALFVDPGDIDKFSKVLYDISINNQLREELVSLGCRRAEFFSWEKTAEKILNILQKIN